jgi:hypothetical protein
MTVKRLSGEHLFGSLAACCVWHDKYQLTSKFLSLLSVVHCGAGLSTRLPHEVNWPTVAGGIKASALRRSHLTPIVSAAQRSFYSPNWISSTSSAQNQIKKRTKFLTAQKLTGTHLKHKRKHISNLKKGIIKFLGVARNKWRLNNLWLSLLLSCTITYYKVSGGSKK